MESPNGNIREPQPNNTPPPPEPQEVTNAPSAEQVNRNQREASQLPLQNSLRVIIEKDERKDRNPIIANILSFVALVLAVAASIFSYKTFDETKQQFTIENEPILQIELPIKIDTLEPDKPIVNTIKVRNLGNYPVKITKTNFDGIQSYKPPVFINIFSKHYSSFEMNAEQYITSDLPYSTQLTAVNTIDRKVYDLIFLSKMPMFLYGYIQYKNLVTGDEKEYDFIINTQFYNLSNIQSQFILNENKVLKKGNF